MDYHQTFSLSNCSPHSSEGVISHHSTPETKLTAFSPEDSRDEPKVVANSGIKIKLPPAFALQGVSNRQIFCGGSSNFASNGAYDPFVTTPNEFSNPITTTIRPKLSPTATSFTPSINNGQIESLENLSPLRDSLVPGQRSGGSAVSYLSATSVPDIAPSPSNFRCNSFTTTYDTVLSPIGSRVSTSTSSSALDEESSNSQGHSRYLMISNITRNVSTAELNDKFTVSSSLHKLIPNADLSRFKESPSRMSLS